MNRNCNPAVVCKSSNELKKKWPKPSKFGIIFFCTDKVNAEKILGNSIRLTLKLFLSDVWVDRITQEAYQS